MTKKRRSVMVSPKTKEFFQKLQGEIQAETGERISITDLMGEISSNLDAGLKEKILNKMKERKLNFKLRYD